MTTTTMAMMTLLDDAQVRSFGEPGRLFEPSAARCSSSSSTCCVGCITL